MSRRRECPACGRSRVFPELNPVCGLCAKRIPRPLQATFGAAVLAGDKRALAKISQTIVETVGRELDRLNLRALDRQLASSRGAR